MAQADLRELRTSKGKTQAQIGISEPWAVELEHGTRLPGPSAVRKLAAALEVSTEEVFAACQESVRRAHEGQPTTGGAR